MAAVAALLAMVLVVAALGSVAGCATHGTPGPAPVAAPGVLLPSAAGTPPVAPGSSVPPAVTGAPAAGALPPVSSARLPASPASIATVSARIRRLVARRPADAVSIAALDLTNGRRYRYPGSHNVRVAGLVQLDLLETVLLRHQQAGQPLTAADTDKATAMIEHGDSDAADTLWDQTGGASAFRALNRQLGVKHTSPDIDRYWALATSDADDQLTLLGNLEHDRPLTAASRSFALRLLNQVDADQAWGVGVAGDPGTRPALKNGWRNADDDNGLWAVGSTGIISVRGHRVLLAVLTQHNPSKKAGVDLVQDLAMTAVAAVAPAPLPTAN
jgi:hypothetical protein